SFLSSKKHPLGEKRNHPGSKLRQGFWMVFRFGVNNWGKNNFSIFFGIFRILVGELAGTFLANITKK
ncbi:hypothetical protein, partial [Streptococcus pneumoniae]|uniref:hypothetical protein n=1 Tax=Streptococcus pneumoniae TaxID=1313 RepID=UPI001C72807E